MEGKGKMTYPNSEVYEGEFKDNCYDGFGHLTKTNNCSYEGEWMSGL